MSVVIGGGKYLVVYTATLGQNPTIGSTPVFSCAAQIKSQVDYNASQSHKIDVEQVQDNSLLYQFIQQHIDLTQTSEVEEITYEDGTKATGSPSGPALLLIVKGGLSGTARKVYTACVKIDHASGAWSQEGNKANRPALIFNSVDPGGTVTVPTTYYTDIATTPSQVTFGLGSIKFGRVHFA